MIKELTQTQVEELKQALKDKNKDLTKVCNYGSPPCIKGMTF